MHKQTTEPFFKAKLRDELSLRQRKNPQYSLRAFAKALGLQPAVLSDILNGKRKLPAKVAKTVSEKLLLSPVDTARFVGSINTDKKGSALSALAQEDFKLIEENEVNFKVISEWEHFAVLDLIKTRGFNSDPEWMAKRLSTTKLRIATVLANLNAAGLIAIDERGRIKLLQEYVATTHDQTSSALKISHKESLELGIKKLDTVDLEERDFSSITFAFDSSKMAAIKKEIQEFRRHLLKKYEESDSAKDSVYQMCFQLFPLTATTSSKTDLKNNTGEEDENS